jgi:YVTN family beta-propeller protein
MADTRNRFDLTPEQMPTAWFNLVPDMVQAGIPPLPPLNPMTKEPIGPADLLPLFPEAIIKQEVSTEQWIDIPGPVIDIYRLWRPSPLFRATRLEEALKTPAHRLYVLNRIANTLSIIDTASDTVLREISVGSFDPTPTFIRQGRGFLYDAKLSGNGTMSCASCHVDAEMDMLAWDLGNPFGTMETVTVGGVGGVQITSTRHPMKGPMTTQTLRGLKGLEPLHWRGDRTNFLAFNKAFPDLFGGPLLTNADLIAYRDFVNSIVFQPNPNQNLDRTLPAEFAGANPSAGRASYQNFVIEPQHDLRCISCHSQTGGYQLPVGNGTERGVVQDASLRDSQHIKIPHLRNLYQKTGFNNKPGAASIAGFGFIHNGTDSTLFDHFATPRFLVLTNNSLVKSNLAALLLCFDTGTAPAVGYTRTISVSNLNTASISNDWALLESQASLRFRDAFILAGSVTNISLIAKGTIDGPWFSRNVGLLDEVQMLYLCVYAAAALVVLVRASGRIRALTARRQLRWIVFGTVFGVAPFAFGYGLPWALGVDPPLALQLTAIPLGLVPLAFASAIVRYRLRDVEVIVKRVVAYAAFVAAAYLLFTAMRRLSGVVFTNDRDPRNLLVSILATAVIVLLAQPVKQTLQNALDAVAADEELWKVLHPMLGLASAEIRKGICRTLLDFIRREFCIEVDYLEWDFQEKIKRNKHTTDTCECPQEIEVIKTCSLFYFFPGAKHRECAEKKSKHQHNSTQSI